MSNLEISDVEAGRGGHDFVDLSRLEASPVFTRIDESALQRRSSTRAATGSAAAGTKARRGRRCGSSGGSPHHREASTGPNPLGDQDSGKPQNSPSKRARADNRQYDGAVASTTNISVVAWFVRSMGSASVGR